MTLISQPGSDYQIASISLDAGYARDVILMLIDALGEATGQLSHAEHQALGSIPPDPTASEPADGNPAASF